MWCVIQLQWLDGDIVCLQEVDTPYFTEILKEDMSFLGYKGMFAQKSQCTGRKVGVALFFKQDKFELEESKTLVINEIAAGVFTEVESNKFGEVLILAALRHKNSNTMLLTGENLTLDVSIQILLTGFHTFLIVLVGRS